MKLDISYKGEGKLLTNVSTHMDTPVEEFIKLVDEYKRDLELWSQSSRKSPAPVAPKMGNVDVVIPAGSIVSYNRNSDEDRFEFKVISVEENPQSPLVGIEFSIIDWNDTKGFILETEKGIVFNSSVPVIFENDQTVTVQDHNGASYEIGDREVRIDDPYVTKAMEILEAYKQKILDKIEINIDNYVKSLRRNDFLGDTVDHLIPDYENAWSGYYDKKSFGAGLDEVHDEMYSSLLKCNFPSEKLSHNLNNDDVVVNWDCGGSVTFENNDYEETIVNPQNYELNLKEMIKVMN